MTDLAQFPEAVRAKIEDLDRRIEGARAEEEDHQRALSRLQTDLSQSVALRKAIIDTAEACSPPQFVIAPNLGLLESFNQTNEIGADSTLAPSPVCCRQSRSAAGAIFVTRCWAYLRTRRCKA